MPEGCRSKRDPLCLALDGLKPFHPPAQHVIQSSSTSWEKALSLTTRSLSSISNVAESMLSPVGPDLEKFLFTAILLLPAHPALAKITFKRLVSTGYDRFPGQVQ